MATAQNILNLLNREILSVSELSARLGISRNSTYVQIAKLEAAGAVEKVPRQAGRQVGKPALGYRTVARHEDTFSTAYKPVLESLFGVIGDRLTAEERSQLLAEAGRRLAKDDDLVPTGDFVADLERALQVVNRLGAMAELSQTDDGFAVRCHSCPLASLVHEDASICGLVAHFFAEATAKSVTVQCRREKTVVCGFAFDLPAETD